MAITKDHVFAVTGRYRDPAGTPRGEVVVLTVCSANSRSARALISEKEPGFAVLSVVGLSLLEDTARQLRHAVMGKNKALKVFVDPALL